MADPRKEARKHYIKDLITGDKVEFQMLPETINEQKSVNWNQIEIIGRSHPILGYASSGPRTINFTLTFFANPSHEDPTSQEKVSSNLRWLMSLAYPDYSGGVKPPHKCMVNLGSQSKMVGVVSDVSIQYTGLWKYGKPVYAFATITFIESEDFPVNYSTIRASGSA